IVFIDEIDKVAQKSDYGSGQGVSREGVQRDLLPLVEGSTVSTKHGPVKTDHMLFIASGAFSMARPSALIHELHGPVPIRVELSALSVGDYKRILGEASNARTRQCAERIGSGGGGLDFSDKGMDRLAEVAHQLHETAEYTGARRLHTVMGRLVEEISDVTTDK